MSEEFDDEMHELFTGETFTPHPRALEVANKYREHAAKYQNHAMILEQHACFISEIESVCPPEANLYMSDYSAPRLTIYLNVKGFLCDAAPELVQILEFLSMRYENPPTSLDSPDTASRLYNFKPAELNGLPICVHTTLVEGDGLCERVITGSRKTTKFVEVDVDEPVFAFKC